MSKNAKVSTGGNKDVAVKYSDVRMSYMSTKSELVIKECETLKVKDVFGGETLCKNSPLILCEDQNGFYVTCKVNVDAPILDGYRMYAREKYSIEKDGEKYILTIEDKTFEL